jgi:hypothetical protein
MTFHTWYPGYDLSFMGIVLDAVVSTLQLWYCCHSIHQYLAWQTWCCLAATTLQCWKRHIWLDCWFAQQAKKCLCLRLLCCGALVYTVLVWGSRHPPPTPTNILSTPKDLQHPFYTRGQPLPTQKRTQCCNRCCCCLGQRNRPHAPQNGGRPSCMPHHLLGSTNVGSIKPS